MSDTSRTPVKSVSAFGGLARFPGFFRKWIWLVIIFWVFCDFPLPSYAEHKNIVVNDLNMTFVLIPAGTFVMGSPATEAYRDDSETAHPVTISRSFYMQTTEVTVDQWRAVMGRRLFARKRGAGDMPVARVSWHDCTKFIRKLNKMTGHRYNLPTEAQWEYAARAGSTTAYFWGDRIDCSRAMFANYPKKYDDCVVRNHAMGISFDGPAPVMRYEPNAWGLYDTHGNVWEWCLDLFSPYDKTMAVDPCQTDSGMNRVRRGGGWFGPGYSCRSANRAYGHPMSRFAHTGFRLVMELPERKAEAQHDR